MKIVHAIETINPTSGGPAVVAIALGMSQASLGHEVTVACYAEQQFAVWLDALRSRLPGLERLRFVGIPNHGIAEKYLATHAKRVLRRLATDADVVHVHGMWNSFNIAASRVSIQNNCKLVITPHGMLDPWSMRQHYWKKKLAMLLVWKNLLNSAYFVHALNPTEAKLLSPLRLHARIKVFPNGIFKEDFTRIRDDIPFRQHYSIAVNKPYILFLGRLHYKKGLDFLIDAFELVCKSDDQTALVIAGPDEGMRAAVQRRVTQRGLLKRVYIVGPLYGENKMSALVGASCFCLPSRQEGFSMAILEALACGVPVVISEECHFPEVAQAGAGVVVMLDAVAISNALLRMLGDKCWRARASRAARELVKARYDWAAIASELVAGYQQ